MYSLTMAAWTFLAGAGKWVISLHRIRLRVFWNCYLLASGEEMSLRFFTAGFAPIALIHSVTAAYGACYCVQGHLLNTVELNSHVRDQQISSKDT